eukprot:scaffold263394_cov21-Tisochrysis_lutea.AAC.1
MQRRSGHRAMAVEGAGRQEMAAGAAVAPLPRAWIKGWLGGAVGALMTAAAMAPLSKVQAQVRVGVTLCRLWECGWVPGSEGEGGAGVKVPLSRVQARKSKLKGFSKTFDPYLSHRSKVWDNAPLCMELSVGVLSQTRCGCAPGQEIGQH